MDSNGSDREKIAIAFRENVAFDSAIMFTGFGRFHHQLLISCAFCLLSAGFQNGLSAYVLPAAQCELDLDSSQIGLINAAFLVGGTCSAFFWGILADVSGRKNLLVYSLLVDAFVTACSTFVQSFTALVICRFISGFLVGAPGSITFTYMAEFQTPSNRAKTICYSGIFFTFSWFLLPVIAWAVLTSQIEFQLTSSFTYNSWRIFLLALTVPEILAGIWLLFLPESPKFLAGKDPNEALTVLKEMFAVNTGKAKEEFPVMSLSVDCKKFDDISNDGQCKGKITRIIQAVYLQMQELFRPPLVLVNVVISAVMFCNMYGYFGLGLWLPELFTRFEEFHKQFPNASITIQQLRNVTNDQESNQTCQPSFEYSVFESTLCMGLSSLAGNVISGWFAGHVQCYKIPLVTMFLGGLSSGAIYWARNSFQNIIVSCLFQATMATANMAIGGVVVDLIPTSVSGMAICTAMCAGRIGAIISNIVFGMLMDQHCEIPIFIVAAVLIVGSLLCLLLSRESQKKTKGEKCEVGSFEDKINVEVSVINVTTL